MGRLSNGNVNVNIYELTIFDIIKQFRHIKDIKFVPSVKTGKDYFDIVLSKYIYSLYSEEEEDQVLLPTFRKEILKLFNDSTNKIHLINLGVTKLDYALLTNNALIMKEAVKSLENVEHIYDLAKKTRFLELGKEIYKEKYAAASIMVNLKNDIQTTLSSCNIVNSMSIIKNPKIKLQDDFKKIVITIQDHGDGMWDYNDTKYEYDQIKSLFDISILCGTGISHIFPVHLKKCFSLSAFESVKEQNLDLAVVRIHMHDTQESNKLAEVIESCPDNIAKETLYIIQTCFSGQYHKNWNKDAFLITSSSADEKSYMTDYQAEELPKYFKNGTADLNGFINFYANYKGLSTPHISGNLNGERVHNKPVSEFWKTCMQADESNDNEAVLLKNMQLFYGLKPTYCEHETVIEMKNGVLISVQAGESLTLYEQPYCITTVEYLGNSEAVDEALI